MSYEAQLTSDSPDVEFCAYSIPHPSEPKMNIRIQTYSTYTQCSTVLHLLTSIQAELQSMP
jgi:DNA-directed RNA polymerases I and III subunit RPAC2